MIHAYDDYYLYTIQKKLGEMFELAVLYKEIDIDEFAKKFIDSKMANAFFKNNFKYTLGKSSVELLAIVLNEEPDDVLLFEPATAEYWVGYVYAYVSWYYNISYDRLFDVIRPSKLIMYYFPYHEMDITRVLDLFNDKLNLQSKLKALREEKKYSQNDLSLLSGIPIRTIRSYEQNSCDISKAQYETLYKLSKALDCKVEDLV